MYVLERWNEWRLGISYSIPVHSFEERMVFDFLSTFTAQPSGTVTN